MDLPQRSLTDLSQSLESKSISSQELVEAYIERIKALDSELNIFLTPTFELAKSQAKLSDDRRAKGETKSPLDGIPITLKDIICTAGVRSTAGSKMLEHFVPPYSATAWSRLEEAGMPLLGKVNCDEFAMGGSTENSAYGASKNPHNPEHVPGGSSGGSAAAVAAHFCPASIGTDTGGSIRQPAHYCGVTGLKVSYGRVSRFGVMAMASSLDTIGPIAPTVEDTALILETLAGSDPHDQTTPPTKVPAYSKNLTDSVEGLTIGIPKQYLGSTISQSTLETLEIAQKQLAKRGVKFKEVSLPHTDYALSAYYLIVCCEVSANLSRYDGLRFGQGESAESLAEIYAQSRRHLGSEVQRRILLGSYCLSAGYYDAYYLQAQKVRRLICQDFESAWSEVDALLTPVSPTAAFKFSAEKSPLELYQEDILTTPASLAGLCGLVVPVGKDSPTDLPIGVQILGAPMDEERILKIGFQLQQAIK